jgi:bifunctional N-acetylglucosamine-1-phosphate-uridyltransferase/glucosamine-1-phosphate-acetyltransferase GlmU-like protein
LVLSGDVPLIQGSTLQDMLISHGKEYQATVGYANVDNPYGLGRIIRNVETQNLEKIIEEKDIPVDQPELRAISEINTGIYLFRTETLLELLPQVNNQNKQQEYYLPDVIKMLTQENKLVNLTPIPEQEAQGINTPQQLQEAEEVYQQMH